MRDSSSPQRICAVLCLFGAGGAVAESPEAEEVTVHARRESSSFHDLQDVREVSATALQRSAAQGLPNILRQQGGVEIIEQPGNSLVMLRGGAPNHTQITVDGMEINAANTTTSALEFFPVEIFEQAKILPGSDGIGGGVHLDTQGAGSRNGGEIQLGGGSYGSYRTLAKVQGLGASGAFMMAAGANGSRGFSLQKQGFPGFPANPDADGHRQRYWLGRGSLHSPAGEWSGMLYRFDQWLRLDNGTMDDVGTRVEGGFTGLSWRRNFSGWAAQAQYTQQRLRFHSLDREFFHGDWKTRQFALNARRQSGFWLWDFALKQREQNFDFPPGSPQGLVRRHRTVHAAIQYAGERNALQAKLQHEQSSFSGGALTYHLAARHTLPSGWEFAARMQTAVKDPALEYLYGSGLALGNINLQTERGLYREASVSYWTSHGRVDLALFRNRIRDLIFAVPLSPPFSAYSRYDNSGLAVIDGAELRYRYQHGPHLLQWSSTWQNPRDRENDAQLPGRARRHLAASWVYQPEAHQYGIEMIASSRRYLTIPNNDVFKADGFSRWNLFARFQLDREWSLLARVDNLTNRDYVWVPNIATAGRSVWLGLKFSSK